MKDNPPPGNPAREEDRTLPPFVECTLLGLTCLLWIAGIALAAPFALLGWVLGKIAKWERPRRISYPNMETNPDWKIPPKPVMDLFQVPEPKQEGV